MAKVNYLIILLIIVLIICFSYIASKDKPLDYIPKKAKLVYLI